MSEVKHINQLGTNVMYFSGTTVEEALKRADEWAKRHGVVIDNYYVQFNGRSIIADYEKEIEDGQL